MSPAGKKFIALFLVLSLVTMNCSIFKIPKAKVEHVTYDAPSQNDRLRSEIEAFLLGTPIVVILHSGAKIKGDFTGLFYVLTEEYAENYTKHREQKREEILLPALRENITVLTELGTHYECEFIGFDHRYLIVRWPGENKIFTISLEIIKDIIFIDENVIKARAVSNLISNGKITPLLSSGIIIESKNVRTQIAWADIDQIQERKKVMSAYIGPILLATFIFGILVKIAIDEIEEELEESCSMGAATSNSPMYAYLDTLRDFRDKYLLPNKFGRELVRLYYKYSPYVANIIAKHKVLKATVRTNLIPLIAFSYSMVHFGPIVTGVILMFIFILPFLIVMFHRRKLRQVR